jgi:hypothetical protein
MVMVCLHDYLINHEAAQQPHQPSRLLSATKDAGKMCERVNNVKTCRICRAVTKTLKPDYKKCKKVEHTSTPPGCCPSGFTSDTTVKTSDLMPCKKCLEEKEKKKNKK